MDLRLKPLVLQLLSNRFRVLRRFPNARTRLDVQGLAARSFPSRLADRQTADRTFKGNVGTLLQNAFLALSVLSCSLLGFQALEPELLLLLTEFLAQAPDLSERPTTHGVTVLLLRPLGETPGAAQEQRGRAAGLGLQLADQLPSVLLAVRFKAPKPRNHSAKICKAQFPPSGS